jgi:hypothetical protein
MPITNPIYNTIMAVAAGRREVLAAARQYATAVSRRQ